MTLGQVIDEHFLICYRELLDAEDAAFDELEHAYEDGDRAHFEADLKAWKAAISKKIAWLRKYEVEIEGVLELNRQAAS